MNDVGIGVIGLGRLGYVHAYNVARRTPHAKLVAVCDQVEDLARSTAAELGCKYYTNMHQMLEDKDIDAVCVVTPTGFHVEPVTAVCAAKKPMFCEKPLAGTMEDNLSLQKLIKDSGIMCQIGFNRRFDPAYVEAENMIKAGEIGKVVYFNGFSRDPFPPPPWACDPTKGGGLFIDMQLHDFDTARFLMLDEVVRVYADETNLVVDSQGINRFADNVTVNLRFRDGALGNCHASMHAIYGYDMRTEVYGEKGNIMIGPLNRAEVTLCTSPAGICKPATFQPEGKMPHFMIRFQEAYAAEIAAFVQCVLDNKPPKVNEDDAVAAFKISMACIRSAGEKLPIAVA
jgi:scyllo-inositol 2-dehydrogenase (NAD+)